MEAWKSQLCIKSPPDKPRRSHKLRYEWKVESLQTGSKCRTWWCMEISPWYLQILTKLTGVFIPSSQVSLPSWRLWTFPQPGLIILFFFFLISINICLHTFLGLVTGLPLTSCRLSSCGHHFLWRSSWWKLTYWIRAIHSFLEMALYRPLNRETMAPQRLFRRLTLDWSFSLMGSK